MQIQFSELARSDIQWWAEKSWFYVKTISHGNPHFKLTTDASLEGRGTYRDGMEPTEPTGGRWLPRETGKNKNINCLELEAAKLGLQALCAKEKDVHIQLDNVTAVTFLNNMFKPFVLWHADPDAYATDAMCLSWKTKYAYIFPPFTEHLI